MTPIKHTTEALGWLGTLQDEVRAIAMTTDSKSEGSNANAMLDEIAKAIDHINRAGAYHLPTLQIRLHGDARQNLRTVG